jgi:hypothetical protein
MVDTQHEITNDSSAFLIVHDIHFFHDNFFPQSSMRISFHVFSFLSLLSSRREDRTGVTFLDVLKIQFLINHEPDFYVRVVPSTTIITQQVRIEGQLSSSNLRCCRLIDITYLLH